MAWCDSPKMTYERCCDIITITVAPKPTHSAQIRGLFLYVGEGVVKEPKTLEEMVQLFKERHLDVSRVANLERILLDCNYYRLSGYFRAFQMDPEHAVNEFRPGTTISDFMVPYLNDKHLRELVLQGTTTVELTTRARLAYYLAVSGDGYTYRVPESYKDRQYGDGSEMRMALIENINKWISISSEVCIRHYLHNGEPVPIWAAVEVLPFDTVSKIISLHANTKALDQLNQSLHLGKNRKRAADIIHGMVYLRNLCSHHCRLWNREIVIVPPVLDRVQEEYRNFAAYEPKSVWQSLIVLCDLVDGINGNDSYSRRLIDFVQQDSNYYAGLLRPKRWR